MSSSSSTQLTLEEAHTLLKQFDCLRPDAVEGIERSLIRQALMLVAQHSDYQILGICADTFEQGCLALKAYTKALDYTPDLRLTPVEGAVYIKFNPKSGMCYADSYPGEHRGVLVACQSAYESGVNDMYGHLPLNLFASEQYSEFHVDERGYGGCAPSQGALPPAPPTSFE